MKKTIDHTILEGEWEKEFDEKVNELQSDLGTEKVYEFGYKYKIFGERDDENICADTDWGNVKKFIERVRSSTLTEVEAKAQALKSTENMSLVCSEYSNELDTSIHFDDGYSQAIRDVLTRIKQLKREGV